MKNNKVLSVIVLFMLLTSCATSIETTKVSIASGYKKIFSQNLGEAGALTELIPVNETSKNWSKMFSLQFMKGAPFSAKKHMEIFVDGARKNCGENFNFKLISEKKNSVTFEWSVTNCMQKDFIKYITPYVEIEDCNINYFTGLIWYGSKNAKTPSKCSKLVTQSEVVRFIRGNDGLHRVAFTQRTNKINGGFRQKWLASLTKAYVKKGGERVIVK